MPLTPSEREHFKMPEKRCHAVWTGDLLEVTYLNPHKQYRRPGKRGIVKGFTPAARLRMLRTVASICWDDMKRGVFITLTYPDEVATRTNKDRTRDKFLFLRYIENYLGKQIGALWRIEWEKRKSGTRTGQYTAHVHMLCFNCPFIPKEVVRTGWRSALGADGPLITWIDGMKDGRKAARYVSKYCAKAAEKSVLDNASYLNISGRHWGVHRRDLIPFAWRIHLPLLNDEDIALCENLASTVFAYFARGTGVGFSVFGTNAGKVGAELFQRMIDKHG